MVLVVAFGLSAQLDLEHVVKLHLSEQRSQERGSLVDIDKSFTKNIVVVPVLWNIFLKVGLSFGSMEPKVGVDNFSSD